MEKGKTTKRKYPKKGEPGYTERNTDACHAAVQIFETSEDFVEAANRYFAECDENNALYGEAGLCLALSKYNKKGRPVTLTALRNWYDGRVCKYLQEPVQMAYLRIQQQIETDPRYQEKGGMATRAIFLNKQVRFGGYQDKQNIQTDNKINITFGKSVDESDFS